MEIPKTPAPADALRTLTAGLGERQSPAAAPIAPADRASIRLLDLPGALQILIAEVNLALTEAGLAPADASSSETLLRWAAAQPPLALLLSDAGSAQSVQEMPARALVEIFLRTLPSADLPPQEWMVAVKKLSLTLAAGSATAIERIAAWQDMPAKLPAWLGQARELALALVAEDAASPPLLLRPEWLGLAAGLARFQRLRRRKRRLLLSPTDADWLDEEEGAPASAGGIDAAAHEQEGLAPMVRRPAKGILDP